MGQSLHGGARPTRPLCIHFNVAVQTIANRLFPTGYDISPDAPNTLDDLVAHIERTGRMCVYDGCSDTTIFDCAEINYAFRAWHDWVHYTYRLGFDAEGERMAAQVQKEHLHTVYGKDHPLMAKWERIIDAEVVAQNDYHRSNGEFPANQMGFVIAHMHREGCNGSNALA